MAVSRRRFLALGAGATAGVFGPAGCGSQRSLGDPDEITLWTWDRSVSDELVAWAETKGIPGAQGFRLSLTNIGGHFNTKVRTALAGKSLVPDIIGINSDVATYFPNQDVFVDLNDFGAAELKNRYLDWKWHECVTPEGRMIAFPMDTGPTGLFYRADLLQEAGITTDPKELAARAPDWHGFITLGKELRKSQERTAVAATSVTFLVLLFDSLAAFAFAKYDFPGRRVLFWIVLATFMIPMQLALVPQFVILAWLSWVGSLKALIIPGAANAFGIFWMRQYAQGAIADELIQASRVDGAGFFRQWWTVGLPVLRPGLAFLGIFTFFHIWNDYLWPLIVMTDPGKVTLRVAAQQLNGVYTTDQSMVIAGALMSVIPLIGVFLIGSRHFVANLAAGAMKF